MLIPGLRWSDDGAGLDGLPWRGTRYPGIEWLDLVPPEAGEPRSTTRTVLIRMAPGCGYPSHRHLGPEDVLVLAGGYRDDDGRVFTAGTFVRYPAGSEHTPLALGDSSSGAASCVLYAVAHGGTEVAPLDRHAPPGPAGAHDG